MFEHERTLVPTGCSYIDVSLNLVGQSYITFIEYLLLSGYEVSESFYVANL
jgi:hypothetical protein